MRKTIFAASILIGTIIGAGIFGIPYVVAKAGFLTGLINISIIGIAVLITMLYLGEIALRTKQDHQLTGYAEVYLGKKGKKIMLLALAFGIYTAIIAYLIGISESISFLFFNSVEYYLIFGLLVWAVLSFFSHFGIKALQNGEFIGVAAVLILIISICVLFANKIDITNVSYALPNDFAAFLVPFGVVLFAFLGYTTIPEVKIVLKKQKNKMKSSIILAILISAVVYIAFSAVVVGYKGQQTPEIATIALGKPFIFLGIFTMLTSYLALMIALSDMFHLDFNQSKKRSILYTIMPPLILFIIVSLTKIASFTKVLSIGGVVSGGMMALLIIAMHYKSKYLGNRLPEYSIPSSKLVYTLLVIIFITGTIAEIINSL